MTSNTVQVLLLDDRHNLEEVFSFTVGQKADLKIRLPKQTMAYVKMGE